VLSKLTRLELAKHKAHPQRVRETLINANSISNGINTEGKDAVSLLLNLLTSGL
jgi:hypothetical protein